VGSKFLSKILLRTIPFLTGKCDDLPTLTGIYL
jgi:hypothetical protein